MTPHIDAEGIWNLVKDWPDTAWPVTAMSFQHGSITQNDSAEFQGGDYVHTPIAYHAFIGAGLAWLIDEGYMPELYRCAEGRGISGGVVRETMAEKDTLLAAVSAAVLAAKGGA